MRLRLKTSTDSASGGNGTQHAFLYTLQPAVALFRVQIMMILCLQDLVTPLIAESKL